MEFVAHQEEKRLQIAVVTVLLQQFAEMEFVVLHLGNLLAV